MSGGSEIIYYTVDSLVTGNKKICRTSVQIDRNEVKVFKYPDCSSNDELRFADKRIQILTSIANKNNMVEWIE